MGWTSGIVGIHSMNAMACLMQPMFLVSIVVEENWVRFYEIGWTGTLEGDTSGSVAEETWDLGPIAFCGCDSTKWGNSAST